MAISMAACLGLASCGPRAGTLSIDLVSDLVPGVEVFVVRTMLASDAARDPELVDLPGNADLADGARIAELRDVPRGEHRVVVQLLDAVGEVLVTRGLDVRLVGSMTVRVVVTRDCVFLGCPGLGDPDDFTECLAGHCVPASCADGSCASDECQTDGDCPIPEAECASTACREGVCFSFEIPGVCDEGTACSPDVGCVAVVAPVDPADDLDGDGAVGTDDCAPDDAEVALGAPETCGDGIDQDCDGADLACPPDDDADGWDALSDCNDANAAINPAEEDPCGNGIDEDCDEYDAVCTPSDADGDQWSVPADCDDTSPLTHPSAFDICGDGIDQDCSGADLRAPCIGGYGQPCAPRGTCLESPRQRLACARANGARTRSCLRCCVLCASESRFRWLNVDHSCARAAARYCARAGRGGLETAPGIDPVQWGTCTR